MFLRPRRESQLICPRCGNDLSVTDSRIYGAWSVDGLMVRRRRKCRECDNKYTTYEVTAEVLRMLLADQARYQLLQDMMAGKRDFEKRDIPRGIAGLLTAATKNS